MAAPVSFTSEHGLLNELAPERTSRRGGREYLAFPNLQDPKWIIPAPAHLRRAALALYSPQRLRGWLLKGAMASGWVLGERVWLDDTLLGELEDALARALGESTVRLALYLGVPGAYRKTTVQVVGPEGRVLAYAKMSASTLAEAALEAERRNLQRLSAVPSLRENVPAVLHWGAWRNQRVLLASAGPARRGPSRLGNWHFEFLQALHDADRAECLFGESPMYASIQDGIRRLCPQLPDPWPGRYARAQKGLEAGLASIRLPVSTAHRDFAPWNTRLGAHGLFVFDWEIATEGAVPLYDALHFEAIQAAVRGRPFRAEAPALTKLLTLLWPAGEAHLPLLYLAYLVDMSLYYGAARIRVPEAGEDRVWHWLGQCIDDWLEQRHAPA
jgi:hypothetical protein